MSPIPYPPNWIWRIAWRAAAIAFLPTIFNIVREFGVSAIWGAVVHAGLALAILALPIFLWSAVFGTNEQPAVFGYVGHWGSGKTMLLTMEGLRMLRDPKCINVYATFHLIDPGRKRLLRRNIPPGRSSVYLDPEKIAEELPKLTLPKDKVTAGFYNGALVDEAGLVMPSRMWDKLPLAFLQALAMGRKLGIRFRWATPSENRIDKIMREVTVHVRKCFGFKLLGYLWFVRTRDYLPGEAENGDKAFGRTKHRGQRIYWRWTLRHTFGAYDTYETVAMGSHLAGPAAAASPPPARPGPRPDGARPPSTRAPVGPN